MAIPKLQFLCAAQSHRIHPDQQSELGIERRSGAALLIHDMQDYFVSLAAPPNDGP